MEQSATMDSAARLQARNRELAQEVAMLHGVLALVREDLHVKDEQIEYLYQSFLASKEHKKQEQDRREQLLQTHVDRLEGELRRRDAQHAAYQVADAKRQHQRDATHSQCASSATSVSLSDLPTVMIVHVLGFLDCRSILQAGGMHPDWRAVIALNSFWKELYLQRWLASDARQGSSHVAQFTDKYLPVISPSPAVGDSVGQSDDAEWRRWYRQRHTVEHNWTHGKARITTLNGHSGTVTCLQFKDSHLVSGSDDGSMMLWSLSPRQDDHGYGHGSSCTSTESAPLALMQQHHRQQRSVSKRHSFHGHGGPIWALHFDDHGHLMSGSYDKTIKLWDLWSGKCVRTLRGHHGWISSLDAHENRLASASWDSTINVWHRETGVLLQTLRDTAANPIYALKWDHARNVFIVGCRRFGVQLWDVETGLKLVDYLGHDANNQVNALTACGDRIISGGSDHTVKVWDRRQATCSSTLLGHKGAVMCVDYNNDHHVVSGSYDTVNKLWDLRRPMAPVTTFEGHGAAVFSLQMDACKLISGSADTTVKIFSF